MSSMKTTPDRDKPVTIKLSKQEKRHLESICKARGISKSEYLRRCIQSDIVTIMVTV